MPTPQETRDQHCREIIALIEEFQGLYDNRAHNDPESLKSLRQDVFQPIQGRLTKQNISLVSPNGHFTPEQEKELTGIMRNFRNEIDLRINLKSADKETREIHAYAMQQLAMFNDNYPKDRIGEIIVNPSTSVKLQNTLRDAVERQDSNSNNRNRF